MSIDSIGNFLTIIRNGFVVGKQFVEAPYSTINLNIAHILKDEGFIKSVEVSGGEIKKNLKVTLKYVAGESVIHEIRRLSRPGRRYYEGARTLRPVRGNLGVSILSTNKGLMTDKRARELLVGGEVICSVW
jgi:small subunit ribosomal protein S8